MQDENKIGLDGNGYDVLTTNSRNIFKWRTIITSFFDLKKNRNILIL